MTVTDNVEDRTSVRSPRVLAAWYRTGASDLGSHNSVFGPLPLPRRGHHHLAKQLLEDVRASGLTGRGGAGFPTARKWESLRHSRNPMVLVNAMEGEPASDKNRALLVGAPHLVLDGAELAALAVGAAEIVVCVPEDRPECASAAHGALEERAASGMRNLQSQVLVAPAGYVAGEESALVSWVGGGLAKPVFRVDKSLPLKVRRRAVLAHNAETLAHVALVARYGPQWFRSAGVPEAPGTCLVTLSGSLRRPGVYEIEMGESIGSVLERATPTSELGGLLVGGYGGTWVAPSRMVTPFAPASLAAIGGAVGPGIIAVLPASACGVAETARVAAYMAEESADQCGPCFNGLPAIAWDLSLLARGEGDRHCLTRLRQRLDAVEGRGACRHPDGAIRLVRSAFEVFAADFAEHSRRHPCDGWSARPILPVSRSADACVRRGRPVLCGTSDRSRAW